MDDDDLRRGRPTSHVAHGEDVAILAGDALFAEAIRLIAECQEGEPASVLGAIREVAAATGVDGMVGGQYFDVTAAALDADSLRLLHSLKTGRLIAASVCSALVLAARRRRGAGSLPPLRHRARPPVPDRRRHPRRDRQRRGARQAARLRRAPRQGDLRQPARARAGSRARRGVPRRRHRRPGRGRRRHRGPARGWRTSSSPGRAERIPQRATIGAPRVPRSRRGPA